MTDDARRYPIGRPPAEPRLTSGERARAIAGIARLPALVRAAADRLPPEMWDVPYRPGGWTARQVVHHLADSHVNFYVRLRLALTEDGPVVRPYREAAWAELPDARDGTPHDSVDLLDALHRRIIALLNALPETDFAREIFHPEHGRNQSIDELLGAYAWHGRHHLAHLELVAASGARPAPDDPR